MHHDDPESHDTDDGSPIDTLEHAAIIINAYVSQGRIGPTRADDFEVETLLAHLSILVHRMEAEARKRSR